jgi:hypothetical protein
VLLLGRVRGHDCRREDGYREKEILVGNEEAVVADDRGVVRIGMVRVWVPLERAVTSDAGT